MQPLVLVVEDEIQTGRLLALTLASHGFRTLQAGTRTRALTQAVRHSPDLVLVDLSIGGVDGVGLTTRLRDWTTAPIVVLLAKTRDTEGAALLDAGANDYLVKPFGTADLLARMRVWLRPIARAWAERTSPDPGLEPLRIDRERRALFVQGREVHITPLECKLLLTLAHRPGKTMSEEQILAAVWGAGSATRVQYLRAQVRQLRQKIERDPARPRHLVTEPGGGYRLKLGQ
ncbi:MAG: winged helix-turn-helix domain-containing protein [Myxococcota bacterium]|nr:winged helix-turn-helix domain-containing protein [Myxococcota bacterium]